MKSRKIKTDKKPLYVTAKETILEMVQREIFPENKLPSEDVLSKELGVSRATIREALSALIREGIITKRHGLGNLIHRSTFKSKFRIDKFSDFRNMLKDAGYSVTVRKSPIRSVSSLEGYGFPDYEFIENEDYILLDRLYFANGKPSIKTNNFIRKTIMKSDYFDREKEFKGEFSNLLNEFSKEEVANSICTFEAAKTDKLLATEFQIDIGDPIIQWYQLFYSIYDNLISYTKISFHPEIVKLSFLQKWS